ncbi:MAG: hypothetical protein KDE58_21110 [Caldilineaceae bacterium]|nr:hypothetical protein [Caldilineaceae bacterium]
MIDIFRASRIFAERRAAHIGVNRIISAIFFIGIALWVFHLCSANILAQEPTPISPNADLLQDFSIEEGHNTPLYWFLLTTAMAMLVPVGFVLVSIAGLELDYAWNAALGALAAVGLASFAYWALGFALQFGGVGLVYGDPGLRQLVWEWSPLSTNWGMGWGVAGLSGWFLSGRDLSLLTYTLFLVHLPWVITAATLPVLALRGRAPAIVTMVLALVIGGFVYPIAGNWVQGGGWLSALGRNLNLGHGLVDFGGAGTIHLVGAGFALAALVVWVPRRQVVALDHMELPPVHLPLLTVIGSLLIFAGNLGWMWSNPLQVNGLGELALMRGSVNSVLVAAGGVIPPLLYTWFVTGQSEPITCARGLVAGVVASLAIGPFVQPGVAFALGLVAGTTIPFSIFVIDGFWHLDDATGAITASGLPAIIGLLFVGIFADGVVGSGWQLTGPESYLGVAKQGVSGLFVLSGFQIDFPGQLQAQAIGVLALSLWGFLTGMLFCIPLGLLFHALEQAEPVATHHAISIPLDVPLREAEVEGNHGGRLQEQPAPTVVDDRWTNVERGERRRRL